MPEGAESGIPEKNRTLGLDMRSHRRAALLYWISNLGRRCVAQATLLCPRLFCFGPSGHPRATDCRTHNFKLEGLLVVLGDTSRLHLRANIDEQDIPRFHPEAAALAVLRGAPNTKFPLVFRRVEPLVVPKRSLTGESTERIETRVLEVIFEIHPQGAQLYVGQQVDVFVDASK